MISDITLWNWSANNYWSGFSNDTNAYEPTIKSRLKYNVSTGYLIITHPPVPPLLVIHDCCNLSIIYCYTILKLQILLLIPAKINKRQIWIKLIQSHRYLCAMKRAQFELWTTLSTFLNEKYMFYLQDPLFLLEHSLHRPSSPTSYINPNI